LAKRPFVDMLDGYQKVGIDTSLFRLYLRGDERHARLTMALFEAIEKGRPAGVASTLTLLELLVEPYRDKDDAAVQDFNVLLPTFPHLALVPLSPAIADKAASYQAKFGCDQSMSIQAATATVEGSDAFITGNRAFGVLAGEIELIILEEYL
jgi:predicted nucleic acid-binding protein